MLAKAIANRLRRIIKRCIDVAQSAFVPRRLISDNILLAYEIIHTLNLKKLGKKGFIVVKLDMSKAYDRVEWNFIKDIMVRMGFARRWIDIIMKCLASVSYSVVVNGHLAAEEGALRRVKASRSGSQISHLLFADDCILFSEVTSRGATILK
ncbi:uncharacterized protein LOC108468759 [Gossypium arboreum]|uniref:Reverse transcriptase domain-containing protein n=1 Tax=Gossypium arboreum TaxID=29729 RepID=A0ABR0PYP1_GOSAR|nr:uncharacterized protein LOC108468759 [Gossypium arboreum]KAK5832123.1 hypothetical protein PVK06_015923 [Gossypium arboreum]